MDTKQETCAERIGAELADREQYLADLFKKTDDGDFTKQNEAYSEIYELALSIDTKKQTTICLSWGGPADYLDVIWTNKEGIYEVTYRFEDWFDTASHKVEEGSTLWRYAEMIIEGEAVSE